MDLFNLMKGKQVLIQDVGERVELTRFFAHNIYRRNEPPKDGKVADFFAPYFTIPAENKINMRGICMYSPVLFVYSGTKDEIKKDLPEYFNKLKEKRCFNEKLLSKWLLGIEFSASDVTNETYTYYFLGEPVELPKRIVKKTEEYKGILNLNKELPRNLLRDMDLFYKALYEEGQSL